MDEMKRCPDCQSPVRMCADNDPTCLHCDACGWCGRDAEDQLGYEERLAQLRADPFAVLAGWLARHNARRLWQQKVPHIGWVDCYAIGAGIAHVTRYRRDESGAFDGWDIYVPASATSSIDETLVAAEAALGLR